MNFTREPIIQTVITPKEGNKLLVRSTKIGEKEEHFVEALEIVSFESALFFRSIEQGKIFLVPVSDYEVFEQKEVRKALKSASLDRTIKIGNKESFARKEENFVPEEKKENFEEKNDRRDGNREGNREGNGKRRSRRRQKEDNFVQEEKKGEFFPQEEMQVSPSVVRKLFPPPSMLIKEKLGMSSRPEEELSKNIQPEEVAYVEMGAESPHAEELANKEELSSIVDQMTLEAEAPPKED